ncbi:MAG TPA: NUDIX domain-containing protein [Acidimicrobiales bacterium]
MTGGGEVARDPRLLELLASRTPAFEIDVQWRSALHLACYLGAAELPDELVISVRVIVRVGDDVVVCTNADGLSHAWPGGRREPGETLAETACREVHEETGWVLDPQSVEPIGFMHMRNTGERFGGSTYPYPDTLQLVVVARATERAADDWTDTEGYELSSRLVPLADAAAHVSETEPMCVPYLDVLRLLDVHPGDGA